MDPGSVLILLSQLSDNTPDNPDNRGGRHVVAPPLGGATTDNPPRAPDKRTPTTPTPTTLTTITETIA